MTSAQLATKNRHMEIYKRVVRGESDTAIGKALNMDRKAVNHAKRRFKRRVVHVYQWRVRGVLKRWWEFQFRCDTVGMCSGVNK